jgi:uncharacterized protein
VPQTRFEWDEAKNEANQRKHGVRFEVAVTAFSDPSVVSYKDRFEDGEERWKTLGMVEGLLLLLVAHTVNNEEPEEEIIRIISARQASRAERRRYEEENG